VQTSKGKQLLDLILSLSTNALPSEGMSLFECVLSDVGMSVPNMRSEVTELKPHRQDAAACEESVQGASVWLPVLHGRSSPYDTAQLHCLPPAVRIYKHTEMVFVFVLFCYFPVTVLCNT